MNHYKSANILFQQIFCFINSNKIITNIYMVQWKSLRKSHQLFLYQKIKKAAHLQTFTIYTRKNKRRGTRRSVIRLGKLRLNIVNRSLE